MKITELHQHFLKSAGISTDTRKLTKNSLFFALKGDNFNGNEFAAQAIEEGCSYAIVDEAEYANQKNTILVESVLKTLQDLANFHRKQFNIPVLGITGSNGKTTTKELIGAVLAQKYNLLITEGNLNNHLGVPFTLLRMTEDHDFAVIEMGANKPGDIKELAEIAEPTHGIITNVGAAHIEGFGSLQGVINTKTEMYRFVAAHNGTLFYNAEDAILTERLPSDVKRIAYGGKDGVVQGSVTNLDPFVNFKWNSEHYQSKSIKTNLVGKYNFSNFLAALAIGNEFNVNPELMDAALAAYIPSNNRSQIQKTERNTLIVDCYNANATSMAAALQSFAETSAVTKLAILGDMRELGAISNEEHQKVVDFLQKHQINAFLVGAEMTKTKSDFPTFENADSLIDKDLLSTLTDTTILIKGSRGIRLEKLIPHL